jgi:hypothetical protein
MPQNQISRRTTIEINKTLQTEEGTIVFEGTLTQEEADYVIEVGLNTLLQAGALPFSVNGDEREPHQFPLDFSEEEQ